MPQHGANAETLRVSERWIYGGLGALAPVIVSALTLDIESVFASNLSFLVVIFWISRCLLLFIVGGFVSFLHKSETDAWRCFVIGISAPALITTAFAGSAAKGTQRKNPLDPGTSSSTSGSSLNLISAA
jgi:hypothetical protein